MQAEIPRIDWNEIQFLDWNEFKQMAPTILRLEITRLGGVIQASIADTDFHNAMVRARFELGQFITCLGRAEKDTVEEGCSEHLRLAIMSMTVLPEELDSRTKDTCRYVLDRLNYVYHRIKLIY